MSTSPPPPPGGPTQSAPDDGAPPPALDDGATQVPGDLPPVPPGPGVPLQPVIPTAAPVPPGAYAPGVYTPGSQPAGSYPPGVDQSGAYPAPPYPPPWAVPREPRYAGRVVALATVLTVVALGVITYAYPPGLLGIPILIILSIILSIVTRSTRQRSLWLGILMGCGVGLVVAGGLCVALLTGVGY